jgi:hypothetical protein
MSKEKKAAYAAKQKQDAATTAARTLTPLGDSGPIGKTAKAPKGKKQSRGK